MKILTSNTEKHLEEMDKTYSVSRRRFFQITGGLTGAGALMSAGSAQAGIVNEKIGKSNTALLNMLYVIQQIESAFYTEAVEKQKDSLHYTKLAALIHVRDQETAHIIVMKRLLGFNSAPAISPNFEAVDFSSETSIMEHAAIIEEMAVAGFNSAAGLLSDGSYHTALSKLAMADAGHTSIFANMQRGSASDEFAITNDLAQTPAPATVLTIAETYIHNRYDKSNLPNHSNS